MPKYDKTIVNFPVNTPVPVVLDSDPARVVGKEKEGNWGPYKQFTYFLRGDKIMFANEGLHNELQKYTRGDTVTITKVQPVGQQKTFFTVDQGAGGSNSGTSNDYVANLQEILSGITELKQILVVV